MSGNFGGNPPDGLQNARQQALGLLTEAMTSDDRVVVKNYVKSVIADGGEPVQAISQLLGGMAGIARILVDMREEERKIPHKKTLEELARKVAS